MQCGLRHRACLACGESPRSCLPPVFCDETISFRQKNRWKCAEIGIRLERALILSGEDPLPFRVCRLHSLDEQTPKVDKSTELDAVVPREIKKVPEMSHLRGSIPR